MKIVVVGLGYVGLPLALQFRRSGVAVTGFDIDSAKVATRPRRESYLRHIPASAGTEPIATGGVCGSEFA